jgi:hypothetical protein
MSGGLPPISAVRRSCRGSSLAPLAADTRPECVSLKTVTIFGTVTLAFIGRSTRALQDCSDRVLAEPDMAADQPVAQTNLCQLEHLLRLAVGWTLSWLAAEPLTAGLGGGDAGLDALADKVPLELGGRDATPPWQCRPQSALASRADRSTLWSWYADCSAEAPSNRPLQCCADGGAVRQGGRAARGSFLSTVQPT